MERDEKLISEVESTVIKNLALKFRLPVNEIHSILDEVTSGTKDNESESFAQSKKINEEFVEQKQNQIDFALKLKSEERLGNIQEALLLGIEQNTKAMKYWMQESLEQNTKAMRDWMQESLDKNTYLIHRNIELMGDLITAINNLKDEIKYRL
mgnify:FL=1